VDNKLKGTLEKEDK
jgi:hypothetical protein